MTEDAYLDVHRLVWDMPSMHEVYPEVIGYLDDRYALAFASDDDLMVFYKQAPIAPERFGVGDARIVVDVLLSREYRAALIAELVLPVYGRFSAASVATVSS